MSVVVKLSAPAASSVMARFRYSPVLIPAKVDKNWAWASKLSKPCGSLSVVIFWDSQE